MEISKKKILEDKITCESKEISNNKYQTLNRCESLDPVGVYI